MTPDEFLSFYMWALIRIGHDEDTAEILLYDSFWLARQNLDVYAVIGNRVKAAAIHKFALNRDRLFQEYNDAEDKRAYLASLDCVGPLTLSILAGMILGK